jgi:hypothetical protein
LEVRHGDDDDDGELCQIGRPPKVAQCVQHANIVGIFFFVHLLLSNNKNGSNVLFKAGIWGT